MNVEDETLILYFECPECGETWDECSDEVYSSECPECETPQIKPKNVIDVGG